MAVSSPQMIKRAAVFDFHDWKTELAKFEAITDASRIREICKAISPIYYVSSASAPTFLMHGDCDSSVPLYQSEIMFAKLSSAGVDAKLIVKAGGEHCWPDLLKDTELLTDWFDQHLEPLARVD